MEKGQDMFVQAGALLWGFVLTIQCSPTNCPGTQWLKQPCFLTCHNSVGDWAQLGSSSPSCDVTGREEGAAVIWGPEGVRTSKMAHLCGWQSTSGPPPVMWPHACGWSSSRQGVWVARGGSFPRVKVPKGRRQKLSVLYGA